MRTFHQQFLDYLCQLALVPGADAFEYDASEVSGKQLHEMYGDQLWFLTPDDWQYMARQLNTRNSWVVRETVGGAGGAGGGGSSSSASAAMAAGGGILGMENKQERDEAYSELVYRLSSLPTYELVRQRLGRQAAEEYRECRERMETHCVVPLTGVDVKSRIGFGKLKEIVHLVTFACLDSRESAIDAFLQYKSRRRDKVRARKRALRECNKPLAQKAKSLKIWFPYITDAKKWTSDTRVSTLYRELLAAIEKIRILLQPYKRFIQYVQRRRYSQRSIKDITQNLEQMHKYIAEPKLLTNLL